MKLLYGNGEKFVYVESSSCVSLSLQLLNSDVVGGGNRVGGNLYVASK